VPHVHVHAVPRNRKDGLRGFFWPRTRYADPADAAAMAESIRVALDAMM
jgi:histidine triad (HIT) family protein